MRQHSTARHTQPQRTRVPSCLCGNKIPPGMQDNCQHCHEKYQKGHGLLSGDALQVAQTAGRTSASEAITRVILRSRGKIHPAHHLIINQVDIDPVPKPAALIARSSQLYG